jgi:hypothetical protein
MRAFLRSFWSKKTVSLIAQMAKHQQQQQQMKKEQETLAMVMMVAAQDLTSLLVVSGSMMERYCLCLVQECCHLN